jgi:hypothetical protein
MVEVVEVEAVLLVAALPLEPVESLVQLPSEVLEDFLMVHRFQEAMVLQILVLAEVAVVQAAEMAVMVHQVCSLLVFLQPKYRRLYLYNTALSVSTAAATLQSPPPIILSCQESQDQPVVLRLSLRTIQQRVL